MMARIKAGRGRRGTGLEYDEDYGVDACKGWTAVVDGRIVVQFVSLPRAVWALVRDLVVTRHD